MPDFKKDVPEYYYGAVHVPRDGHSLISELFFLFCCRCCCGCFFEGFYQRPLPLARPQHDHPAPHRGLSAGDVAAEADRHHHAVGRGNGSSDAEWYFQWARNTWAVLIVLKKII